ncbi:cysteinyl-tRNA synthetase [compost metagenome]
MRDELANDLNAPGAIAAVDHWAAEAIRSGSDKSEQDTALVTDAIDALLGVEL